MMLAQTKSEIHYLCALLLMGFGILFYLKSCHAYLNC